jgi:hypothetical protein
MSFLLKKETISGQSRRSEVRENLIRVISYFMILMLDGRTVYNFIPA